MITEAIVAAAMYLIPPPGTPPNDDPSDQLCLPLPPPALDVDVSFVDGERSDASRFWESSATYQLSSGDVGEAHIVIEEDGSGEAYFAINGEIVGHASIEDNEVDGPNVATWFPTELNYSAELVAELLQREVGDAMIKAMVPPEEFKCSPFGRKVVKVAKYLWMGASTAAGVACCAAVQAGCPLCAAGATIAGAAGADVANEYCD